MVAIFQTTFTFSSAFSWMKIYKFWLRFHWNLFQKVQLKNIPTLVQIMAWHRPGDKPLSEPPRTPAFWDTPAAPWLPMLVIHIRYQSKQDKVKVTNLKRLPKNSKLKLLQPTFHTTHLLEFFDKMYRVQIWNGSNHTCRCYRVDTWCGTEGWTDRRTDGRTDGWTDWVKPIYPPNNFVVRGGGWVVGI